MAELIRLLNKITFYGAVWWINRGVSQPKEKSCCLVWWHSRRRQDEQVMVVLVSFLWFCINTSPHDFNHLPLQSITLGLAATACHLSIMRMKVMNSIKKYFSETPSTEQTNQENILKCFSLSCNHSVLFLHIKPACHHLCNAAGVLAPSGTENILVSTQCERLKSHMIKLTQQFSSLEERCLIYSIYKWHFVLYSLIFIDKC